jgi:hypothetical protein
MKSFSAMSTIDMNAHDGLQISAAGNVMMNVHHFG